MLRGTRGWPTPRWCRCPPVGLWAPKAYVVAAPGRPGGAEAARRILDRVQAELPPEKWVRVLEFVPSLPRTTSGKVRRAELRDRGADSGGVEYRVEALPEAEAARGSSTATARARLSHRTRAVRCARAARRGCGCGWRMRLWTQLNANADRGTRRCRLSAVGCRARIRGLYGRLRAGCPRLPVSPECGCRRFQSCLPPRSTRRQPHRPPYSSHRCGGVDRPSCGNRTPSGAPDPIPQGTGASHRDSPVILVRPHGRLRRRRQDDRRERGGQDAPPRRRSCRADPDIRHRRSAGPTAPGRWPRERELAAGHPVRRFALKRVTTCRSIDCVATLAVLPVLASYGVRMCPAPHRPR